MSDTRPETDTVFNLENLRHLAALMEEHGLSEVDLSEGDRSVRLKRNTGPAAAPAAAVAPATAAPAPPAAESQEHIVTIKSPMIGTFYSKPNPNAENYVKVGDHVSPETVICIVEAMKTFNEIPAEVSGQIVSVLVKNEEPVEYGAPLFKVDTSK